MSPLRRSCYTANAAIINRFAEDGNCLIVGNKNCLPSGGRARHDLIDNLRDTESSISWDDQQVVSLHVLALDLFRGIV